MERLLTRERRKVAAGQHRGGINIAILMLAVFVIMSSAVFAAPDDQAVTVNVLNSDPNQVVIQYKFDDLVQRPINIGGKIFTEIHLGKESLKKEVGAPELPDVSRSIIIPDNARMAVSVIDGSYYEIENINIPPSKGFILRNVNPADVPYTFGKAYRTNAFYPGPLATLREPYIMRDCRGIVVTVHPFQYNPARRVLRVYTDITVQVTAIGKDSVNVMDRKGHKRKLHRVFRDIYSSQFINYSASAAERSTTLDEQGNMLIIAYDPWLGNVQPLADYKNSIGINTTVVGVSTIGNNATSIKNYIQNVYNTSDLAFILLVGDAAQVATPTASGGSSDPTYSKLAGSDDYPDIFVGRFSAETAANVDTQVLKTIEYETMPATQQGWFWRGVGIASPEGDSTTGDDGQSDQQHIEALRLDLLAYNYTLVDQIYEAAGPTAADITNALNAGRGVINYCGHGSTTAWGTTGFSVTNVNALTNYNMLPFIFDVACVNGQFNGYTCFAEAWMRAASGGEPTGAIGIYASSINQSWAPPMEAQDKFNSLYIAGTYGTYGALCYTASCSMMDKYGSGGVSMFNTWHIFGDPSLRVVGTAVVDNTVARNPSPADEAAGIDPNVILSWTPGIYAGSHDVYFGVDYNSVMDANHSSSEYKGNQPLDNNSYNPGTLDYSSTYYWAIDEINEANIWPGKVWEFTTIPLPPGQAVNPNPANGATNVSRTQDLSWTAGSGAASHDVYFGTTNPPPFKVNQSGTTYDTGTMAAGTTYYWRIDEKNAGGTTTGTVWSFTTTTFSPVAILGSWVTGTTHAKVTGTNRALIFLAHAERNSSGITLNSVTYGGRAMTKVVEKVISSGTTRTYVAAFILNDAGINAATTTTFTPKWSATPTSYAYSSVFLKNVNQTTLTGATASNATSTGATITTSALANSAGDMVIDAATCSNTGSYTVNNGFTEALELTITNADGVDGYKSATGANETPSVKHSTTNGRQSLIGFVVRCF
jgi:hypothetical protein